MDEKTQATVDTETYEPPAIVTLGTFHELTQYAKCSGSADQFLPTLIKPLQTSNICS